MGVVTTFLVRWSGGWTDLTNGASPRSEAFLSVGAVMSQPEALRLAQSQLDIFGTVSEKLTVGVVADAVQNPAVPFIGFKVGDDVEAPSIVDGTPVTWRVGGISISENTENNGEVTVTPTLINQNGQWMPDAESAALQAAKKLANGTLGGSAKVAQPPSPADKGIPISSLAGT